LTRSLPAGQVPCGGRSRTYDEPPAGLDALAPSRLPLEHAPWLEPVRPQLKHLVADVLLSAAGLGRRCRLRGLLLGVVVRGRKGKLLEER
jgi:hypothetical protein